MSPPKKKRSWQRKFIYACLLATVLGLLGYFVVPFAFPIPQKMIQGTEDSVLLLDRNGEVLEHWVRPDFYRHRAINLDLIPEDLLLATLAAEDKRFYQHGGIDFRATARALKDSIQNHRFVSGASTITQQTVKITSKRAPRSFSTKIRECFTARHVEMSLSKKQILSAYFNNLDYGNRSQGPLQAARQYFGKPLNDLSLAECALLAGLPQAPTRLNPRRNPKAAIKRRNWILDRMAIVCHIPQDRIDRAKAEPLQLDHHQDSRYAPHLAYLMKEAIKRNPHRGDIYSVNKHANKQNPSSKRHDIRTTLSAPLQRDITEIVRSQLVKLSDKHIHHAAVIVIDNQRGEILAHVGTPTFQSTRSNKQETWQEGSQIDATRIPRSPGSALKPFTYLLAFEKGGMSPATIIPDIPTSFTDSLGEKSFVNYNRHFQGPVTIHYALANSLNIPAIRTLNRVGGPQALIDLLRRFGITTLNKSPRYYGLGLTLGSGEVTLTELTNAYATLARLGHYKKITFFPNNEKNTQSNTDELTGSSIEKSCWMLAQTMTNNAARTASFGPNSNLRLPFRCAVKTGTSTDFRDNWCLGFTPRYTVGVWVGNLDNTPMQGISGVTGAGPIFHDTMMRLYRGHDAPRPEWFKQPEGMVTCHIHTQTGKRLPKATENTVTLILPADKLPLPEQPGDYTPDHRIILDLRYAQWLKLEGDKARFALAKSPDYHANLLPPLHILSPTREAKYLIDPDLPGQGKKLYLKTDFNGKVTWSSPTLKIIEVNGQSIATLTPGTHTITLSDSKGRHISRLIQVEEL